MRNDIMRNTTTLYKNTENMSGGPAHPRDIFCGIAIPYGALEQALDNLDDFSQILIKNHILGSLQLEKNI